MSENIKVYVNGQEWKDEWHYTLTAGYPSEVRIDLVSEQPRYDIRYSTICAQCQRDNTPETLDAWLRVARYRETDQYFCSLMCLANWLAGELAKEESKE